MALTAKQFLKIGVRLDWTQRELGERIGVPSNTVALSVPCASCAKRCSAANWVKND